MESTRKIQTPPYVRPSVVKKIERAIEELHIFEELGKKSKKKHHKNGKSRSLLKKINGDS